MHSVDRLRRHTEIQHPATEPGEADAEVDRLVGVTNRLDHHVDHSRTGQFRHRLHRIHFRIADRCGRAVLKALSQPRGEQVDADDLSGAHVRECQVEELPDGSLSDDGEVEIDDSGEFLESEQDGAQRLSQQRVLAGHSSVHRDRAGLVHHVAFVQAPLLQRHRQHQVADFVPLAVGRHHRPDHLVQRMPLDNRVLVAALEEGQVRSAQARQVGLEDDLARPLGIANGQLRLGNLNQFHLQRGGHLSGKHERAPERGVRKNQRAVIHSEPARFPLHLCVQVLPREHGLDGGA